MKRRTLLLLIAMLVLWISPAFAGLSHHEIVVNIPGFSLYVYEDGIVIREYPISIGSEVKPSQLGETTIVNKVTDPTYYPPRWWERGLAPLPPGPNNPVGTRWLGLGFPSYGIHGTNNPSSIGTAASSGCIRMNNHDVEELANLVSTGTTVKLMYQTVLLEEDPLFLNKSVTVYEDIYNRGATLSQLEEELARRGWDDVFWPAMQSIIDAASGEPQSIPLVVPVFMNDDELPVEGVRSGSKFFIPYDPALENGTDENRPFEEWGGETYLDVEQYADWTGLSCELSSQGIRFRAPQAYLGDIFLGNVLTLEGTAYVPVKSLVETIPAEMGSLVPTKVTVVRFQGDYYVPSSVITQFTVEKELRIEEPPSAAIE